MQNSKHWSATHQVDVALEQIEAEEERQKQAIDAFYAREDAIPPVSWQWALVGLFLGGGAVAYAFWWIITGVLNRFQP